MIEIKIENGEVKDIKFTDTPALLTAAERQVLSMRMWHPDNHNGYTREELAIMWETELVTIRELESAALIKLASHCVKALYGE